MTATDEPESDRAARELYSFIGLSRQKVPTTHERTPDFKVDGDGSGYLVCPTYPNDRPAYGYAPPRGSMY